MTLDYLASGGDNFWFAVSSYVTLEPMDVHERIYSLQGRISTVTEKPSHIGYVESAD